MGGFFRGGPAKPTVRPAVDAARVEADKQEKEAKRLEDLARTTDIAKAQEIATSNAAIFSGAEEAIKKRKKNPGTLMTSGASYLEQQPTINPVGNRKTLLGY